MENKNKLGVVNKYICRDNKSAVSVHLDHSISTLRFSLISVMKTTTLVNIVLKNIGGILCLYIITGLQECNNQCVSESIAKHCKTYNVFGIPRLCE